MNITESLLSWKRVLELIPLSRRDLQRRVAANTFPKPRKLGRRAVFAESEIRAFIENFLREKAK